MAAPKLKYASGNSSSTTPSSSISDSDTSFPLTSDTNFSAKSGAGMIIAGEGTSNEELAYATGKSGAALTIPLANRGLEGTSAHSHTTSETIKGILTAGMWNDLVDSIVNWFDPTTGVVKPALGSDANGDVYYRSGGVLARLGIGSSNQVLTVSGGAPAWSTPTASTDGWFSGSAYTWVYASASSFTISGVDLTAVFQKGTFIRFKQGGSYKYAVVSSSSFSTNTTVNIIVNTDYTIANSAITDNYYSYSVNPEGFPTWFNYSITGTWNGTPPSGSKTKEAKYSIVGRTCHVFVSENNTVAGVTNGTYNFDGPIAANLTASVYYCGGSGAISTGERSTIPTNATSAYVYGTGPTIYMSLSASINAKSAFVSVSYPI